MRRSLALVAALALAACGGGTASPTSTTSPEGPAGTVAVERASLGYGYEPGTRLVYDVQVEQRMLIDADGDAAAFGEDEELPLQADLVSVAGTEMTYVVHPGPREGTYEIEVTGDFSDLEVEGTVNGEPFDDEAGDHGGLGTDLAEMPPVDVSVIVDERGEVISVTGPSGQDLMLGDLAALSRLGSDRLGRPLGPAFPADREIGVGDTWTEERTEDGPDGPISSRATHAVTGVEEVDGVEVLVIESTVETDRVEVDLSEMMRTFFEGFAAMASAFEEEGDEATTDTTLPPEVEEMLAQVRFLITVEPSTATATTWFDPVEGVVREALEQHDVVVALSFRAPDEETGEMAGFTMDLSLDQTSRFTLVESGPAGAEG